MQHRNGTWRTICAAWVVGACFANAAFAQDLQFQLIGGAGEGDGGPAMQASLPQAGDLAYDAQGNLYVALWNNNRIRRIAPNGTITTVVGGITGFGGDGGPATAAKTDRPDGIAFDAAGNLYFSDTGNRRIRRIAPNGTISTYAGNGGRTSSGDGGQATNASFASVDRIAFDSAGNLYVAERLGHRVRKITPAGIISTFAGTGVAGEAGDGAAATSALLNTPTGVVVGLDGTVYIADTNNNVVRAVAANGTITRFASITWGYPYELAIGPAGNLYVGNAAWCYIVSIAVGGTETIVSGDFDGCGGTAIDGQPAVDKPMGIPDGIVVDPSGHLVYSDWDAGQVRRIDASTRLVSTVAGSTGAYVDGRNAIGAPLGFINGVGVDDAGNVLLTDAAYRRVHRITPAGKIDAPVGTGLSPKYYGDCPAHSPCGGKSFPVAAPWGIVGGDAPGEILFTDRSMDRIYRVSASGMLTTHAGSSTGTVGVPGPALSAVIDPYGMARAPTGEVYFANSRGNVVQRLEAGEITNVAGIAGTGGNSGDGGLATDAQMWLPQAVAVDAAGDVLFSDVYNAHIRKFTPGGNIVAFAGNGVANAPASGDGGPATAAALGSVGGIAVHGTDTYISSDGQLRRIGADGIIRAVPGWTHRATGLAVRGDVLYVATAEGHVYRATLTGNTVRDVAHDYDGDGHSDILWRNASTGTNAVWRTGNHATQLAVTGVTNLAWKIVGQGDFDGDGTDDLVWRNTSTGVNALWRSANSATQLPMPAVSLSWSVAGVGDFDGDGADDLLWRNGTTGANAVWRSGNSTTQLPVTGVTNLQWRVVGVGDFDHDGKSDILWRNTTTGINAIWRSANNATQLPVTGVTNLAWKVQGVGDFNGDGLADVFWRNVQTGINAIWKGAQSTSQQATTAVTGTQWKVVAVGDYDGDGSDDLLWRSGTDGRNGLWRSGNSATQIPVVGVTNTAWSVVPYTNQP